MRTVDMRVMAAACAIGAVCFVENVRGADGDAERAARGVTLLAGVKFSHSRDITNPYLPLSLLKQDVLEGTEDGKKVRIERTAKPGVRKTFKVGGQNVEAFVVEDREMEDGVLAEVATDYFAQDDNGAVYYLGEDVDEYKDGKVVGHGGAWMLGKDTDVPGVILPGKPKVGDTFKSEDVSKEIDESDEVLSKSERVTVPAGLYKNCIKVKETLGDETVEYKYYAKGVGVVREMPAVGDVVLMSHDGKAAAKKNGAAGQVANGPAPVVSEADARAALSYVGADPDAEAMWMDAINDPATPAESRHDLIEDLNDDGFPDPKHLTADDLPLVESRLALIEQIAPNAADDVNLAAFAEAYKDLVNMEAKLTGQ